MAQRVRPSKVLLDLKARKPGATTATFTSFCWPCGSPAKLAMPATPSYLGGAGPLQLSLWGWGSPVLLSSCVVIFWIFCRSFTSLPKSNNTHAATMTRLPSTRVSCVQKNARPHPSKATATLCKLGKKELDTGTWHLATAGAGLPDFTGILVMCLTCCENEKTLRTAKLWLSHRPQVGYHHNVQPASGRQGRESLHATLLTWDVNAWYAMIQCLESIEQWQTCNLLSNGCGLESQKWTTKPFVPHHIGGSHCNPKAQLLLWTGRQMLGVWKTTWDCWFHVASTSLALSEISHEAARMKCLQKWTTHQDQDFSWNPTKHPLSHASTAMHENRVQPCIWVNDAAFLTSDLWCTWCLVLCEAQPTSTRQLRLEQVEDRLVKNLFRLRRHRSLDMDKLRWKWFGGGQASQWGIFADLTQCWTWWVRIRKRWHYGAQWLFLAVPTWTVWKVLTMSGRWSPRLKLSECRRHKSACILGFHLLQVCQQQFAKHEVQQFAQVGAESPRHPTGWSSLLHLYARSSHGATQSGRARLPKHAIFHVDHGQGSHNLSQQLAVSPQCISLGSVSEAPEERLCARQRLWDSSPGGKQWKSGPGLPMCPRHQRWCFQRFCWPCYHMPQGELCDDAVVAMSPLVWLGWLRLGHLDLHTTVYIAQGSKVQLLSDRRVGGVGGGGASGTCVPFGVDLKPDWSANCSVSRWRAHCWRRRWRRWRWTLTWRGHLGPWRCRSITAMPFPFQAFQSYLET